MLFVGMMQQFVVSLLLWCWLRDLLGGDEAEEVEEGVVEEFVVVFVDVSPPRFVEVVLTEADERRLLLIVVTLFVVELVDDEDA